MHGWLSDKRALGYLRYWLLLVLLLSSSGCSLLHKTLVCRSAPQVSMSLLNTETNTFSYSIKGTAHNVLAAVGLPMCYLDVPNIALGPRSYKMQTTAGQCLPAEPNAHCEMQVQASYGEAAK